jgi:hypothetical protein
LPNQEVTVRRLFVTVMFAACFLFLLPGPAHAWWHWLDQYSGPGPFTGPDLQWRLVCLDDPLLETRQVGLVQNRDLARRTMTIAQSNVEGKKAALKAAERLGQPIAELRRELDEAETALKAALGVFVKAQSELTTAIDAVRNLSDPGDYVLRSLKSFESGRHPRVKRVLARSAGLGCAVGQDTKNPVASLNFRTAFLWSIHNRLEYEKAPPRVFLWQPELSFSVFVDQRKSVELMTGAGLSRASGEGFDPFWRFYWKPIGLTVTPVPLVRTGPNGTVKDGFWDRTARSFSISSSIVYMPKGFEAADFGARGPFKIERELVGTVALVFDLSRF